MKLFILATLFILPVHTFATQTLFNRVVVFGDSLSDVGTYAPVASLKGGGKFTTNPGKIWVENVSEYMGLSMKPNRHEGFGIPFKIIGGFNYAQGGARLVGPGEMVDNNEKATRYSARPIAEQVGYFLIDQQAFAATDLVFIQGGANDVLSQLRQVGSKIITPQQAIANMEQAAEDLSIIVGNLQNSEAKHIVLVNLPMIQKTPKALGSSIATQMLIAQMVQTFNSTLAAKVILLDLLFVDLYSFDKNFTDHYLDYGFENVDQEACDTTKLYGGTSLFCSPKTLRTPNAAMVRKFADNLHPATGFSIKVGHYVWDLLKVKYQIK